MDDHDDEAAIRIRGPAVRLDQYVLPLGVRLLILSGFALALANGWIGIGALVGLLFFAFATLPKVLLS